jgi:hypothetical protein
MAQRINDLTGINAHPQDPVQHQKRFSWVRVWQDASTNQGYNQTDCDAAHTCFQFPDPNPGQNSNHFCKAVCPDVNQPSDWHFAWNPSYNQTGAKLNYDEYYASLSKRVIPVLKGTPPSLRGNPNYPGCANRLEQKHFCLPDWCNDDPLGCGLPDLSDLPPLADQSNPATYKQHALWLSLFAAKYGQSSYPLSFVDPYVDDKGLTIGKNLIQYLEDNNEPNKNWYDTQATPTDFANGNTFWYFSPNQFSAMLYADYNGNNGALTVGNQTLGVANASGSIKFAMGGLSGLHGRYLEDMSPAPLRSWVANFHHYCTDLSAAQQDAGQFQEGEYKNYTSILLNTNGGQGVSPETDNLRNKLKWLKAGVGNNFSEYWFSEFGYDTYNGPNGSGVEAPKIGAYDSQKVQGQWLVRGILETAWSQSIDKMMLFELKDNPVPGTDNYSASGLLTGRGVGKRSWFYIMTLKSILGEHTFDKEIMNGLVLDGNHPSEKFIVNSSGNDIRVYEFRRGGGELTFAIWSPTQEAKTPFNCSITFPNLNDYPEYVLNGGATLYEIIDMSERGKRRNWSSHVNGQTITINGEVQVSETPIFLKINKNLPTPPATNHVTNLQCTNHCCNSVKLSWSQSSGTTNSLIFYRETTPGNPCPPFDFAECTLFSNNTGANRKSITITGLEANKHYCFYVIPISYYGAPPDDPSLALSCSTTIMSCSSCLIPISSGQLVFGDNHPDLIAQANEILAVNQSPTCTEIGMCDNTQPLQGWTHWIDPSPALPEPNTIYISFQSQPKQISAIYAQDWIGNGDIRIEYRDCWCIDWRPLTTLKLKGTEVCQNGIPSLIEHTVTTNAVIKELRITKLHPDAVVRRLFFCGNDANCFNGGISHGEPTDFTVDEIRDNSVVLQWSAAPYNALNEESGFADFYDLFVSQQVDANNQLVEPEYFPIQADPLEATTSYRLSGLAPGTTYYADLVTPYPECTAFTTNDTIRIDFRTESSGIGNRNDPFSKGLSTKTSDPFQVFLRPNPASSQMQVKITSGELESLILMDAHGKLVKKLQANGTEASLNMEGLPNGIYWVRTIRTDKTFLTVLLIKSS